MPLHSGTQSLPNKIKVAVGSFTGDGASSRQIIDPGFRPTAVWVFRVSAVVSNDQFFRTVTMPDGRSKNLNFSSAFVTNGILSLNKAGFTVGSAANSSGISFQWLAIGDSLATNLKVASYTGDGTGARTITGVGFQPDYVFLVEDGAVEFSYTWLSTIKASVAADRSHAWGQALALQTGKITDNAADGFSVGTAFNVNGRVYHYVAMIVEAGVTEQASFAGNGVNRTVNFADTTLTDPEYVFIYSQAGITGPTYRPRNGTGLGFDQGLRAGDTTQPNANEIRNIPTGTASMSLGSDASVNQSGQDMHYVVWKSSAFTPIVSTPLKVKTGSYVGTATGGAGSGQSIVGVGFKPRFLITRNITSFSGATSLKTEAMAGARSVGWDQFSGGLETTAEIQSLDFDGFTLTGLGAPIASNQSGDTYIFIAIGGDDAEEVMVNQVFVGDGTDNRQFQNVGFEPDCLLGGRANLRWHFFYRSNGPTTDLSFFVAAIDDAPEPDFFQQLIPSGYEVGTANNQNGTRTYVTAWKERVGELEQRSYVGNNVDNRNIALQTGAFTNGLSILFINNDGVPLSTADRLVYRPDFFTVDAGTLRVGITAPIGNAIQDLVGGGNGFQIGTATSVNRNGITHHYLAMGDGTPLQAVATAPRLQVSALGPAVSNPDLPIDSIVRAAIQASIPVELLKRLNTLPRLETEFNASTFVSSGQIILPIEILAGLAGNVQMPIDARGTTALATAANMQISFLGRLATDSNLEIEVLAGRAMAPHMPVSFIANIATAPHMPVEFLGTVAISTGPHLEIEFLQGVSAPPILPIDQIGVTVLRTTANMPIESLAEIFARATMDVEAAGEGLSIAFVFGVQRKLREPFTFEFIIIPATIIGNILPFTFNVENIMGNILPVSFRVLPDLIITLFGDDIQFPFGRADKNP